MPDGARGHIWGYIHRAPEMPSPARSLSTWIVGLMTSRPRLSGALHSSPAELAPIATLLREAQDLDAWAAETRPGAGALLLSAGVRGPAAQGQVVAALWIHRGVHARVGCTPERAAAARLELG
jgi:hypothetical protein